ncbi:MAG: hypothetical protein HC830_13535 [Bacteroidetes bacterium]|nr:hypothetical protein [Bacteroidota bacterium]
MGKRKIYGVLFLNNFWQWSGGMSQYVSWTDGSEMIDPTQGDWNKFYDYTSSFYANQKANELWRQYIQMLVNRKTNIPAFFTGTTLLLCPGNWQMNPGEAKVLTAAKPLTIISGG